MARPWCAPGKRFGPSAPVGKANREKDKEAFNGKKKRENATAALDKTHSSAAVLNRFECGGFCGGSIETRPEPTGAHSFGPSILSAELEPSLPDPGGVQVVNPGRGLKTDGCQIAALKMNHWWWSNCRGA